MTLYGGIESGGSKWECAIGTGADDLRARATIPTTTPAETIDRVVAFFESGEAVSALGIGSFGPVDPDTSSSTWGHITTTPKPGWAHTDVGQEVGRRLAVPVVFDTDVNAAALGEHLWGAARGLQTFCYVTVGTGIGGGVMVNGALVHGLVHPEFGHMRIPPTGHWIRSMASVPTTATAGRAWRPAVRSRRAGGGQPTSSATPPHGIWRRATSPSASSRSCRSLSPERIVLGGGVMKQPGLLALVRQQVRSAQRLRPAGGRARGLHRQPRAGHSRRRAGSDRACTHHDHVDTPRLTDSAARVQLARIGRVCVADVAQEPPADRH